MSTKKLDKVADLIYIEGYDKVTELPMSKDLVITLKTKRSHFNGSLELSIVEGPDQGAPASDSRLQVVEENPGPELPTMTQLVSFREIAKPGMQVKVYASGAYLGGPGGWEASGNIYTLVEPKASASKS